MSPADVSGTAPARMHEVKMRAPVVALNVNVRHLTAAQRLHDAGRLVLGNTLLDDRAEIADQALCTRGARASESVCHDTQP